MSSCEPSAADRAAPSPAAPAFLVLRVIPWAEIAVDGKAVGKSPLQSG